MAKGSRLFAGGETQEIRQEGDNYRFDPQAQVDTGADADQNPKGNGSTEEVEEDGKKKKSDGQKRADFGRLASSRATDALKAMMLLGHLANPSQYLWTEEQETKICDALAEKVAELRKQFAASRAPQDGKKRPKQLLISV